LTARPGPGCEWDKHALGFLRSYSFLIQRESDYLIAQRADLLPKYVSFDKFQQFIRPFRSIQDGEVSGRYHYGQMRLTRLNWVTRLARAVSIFSPSAAEGGLPWNYQEQKWQTSQYIHYYAAILLFAFAALSIILSAMQVALAALEEDTWEAFGS
jgi:hypothetical protein